jgi:hypothetical protein
MEDESSEGEKRQVTVGMNSLGALMVVVCKPGHGATSRSMVGCGRSTSDDPPKDDCERGHRDGQRRVLDFFLDPMIKFVSTGLAVY